MRLTKTHPPYPLIAGLIALAISLLHTYHTIVFAPEMDWLDLVIFALILIGLIVLMCLVRMRKLSPNYGKHQLVHNVITGVDVFLTGTLLFQVYLLSFDNMIDPHWLLFIYRAFSIVGSQLIIWLLMNLRPHNPRPPKTG
jgi:hypothetical protein